MKIILLICLLGALGFCQFQNTGFNLQCSQLNATTCKNNTKWNPVCAISSIFPSRMNYSNECLACNDEDNPVDNYTLGYCSPPAPPAFIDCLEHTVQITKCELLAEMQSFMNCVIDSSGRARMIDSINLCTDLCAPANVVKYLFMDCDFVHEGKTVEEWASTTTDFKRLPSVPFRTLKDGYTRCPEVRVKTCPSAGAIVCGVINEDTQDEFNNSCQACANNSILGYSQGRCKKVVPPDHVICTNVTSKIEVNRSKCNETWVCVIDNLDNIMYMNACKRNPCYEASNVLYVNDSCTEIYEGLPIMMWGFKIKNKLKTTNATKA